MTRKKSIYHYTESGLSNIWLVNGFSLESIDGEKTVSICDIDHLHRTIGIEICRNGTLSGEELRFLRKEMGLSQVRLADILGVSENSILNWEKNASIPNTAITVVKGLYLEHLHQAFTVSFLTRHSSQAETATPMEFVEVNGRWLKHVA